MACLLLLCLGFLTSSLVEGQLDFYSPPVSQAIVLGNDLYLHCQVYGPAVDPFGDLEATLTFEWIHNNLAVKEVEPNAAVFPNHTLFIPRSKERNLGSYECWVKDQNNVTETSPTAMVVEAYTRPFILSPQAQEVKEGDSVILECVTGYSAPPANITWLLNGQKMLGGQQTVVKFGITLSGVAEKRTSQLSLQKIKVNESGTYQCQATNPLSNSIVEMSQPAQITVIATPVPPSINPNYQADYLGVEGFPFFMDCPIGPQSSILSTRWYRAGVRIRTLSTRVWVLTNGTLYFERAQRLDASSLYMCQAVSIGLVLDGPLMNVTIAYLDLQFQQPPKNIETTAGQPLTIACTPPLSVPPATVQWYKGDSLLNYREGQFSVSQLANGSLHFKNVQLGDVGEYSCEALNPFAQPSSCTAPPIRLSLGSSPVLLQPPLPRTLVRGDLLTLTCAVQGQPQPNVTWFKDDLPLDDMQSHVTIRQGGQEVVIQGVTKFDEASYYCLAKNIYGQTKSAKAKITIIVPPEILVPPMQEVTVMEGEDAILDCPVHADPPAKVTWYKDDMEIDLADARKYRVDAVKLTLLSTTRGQAGLYECKAENPGGIDRNYVTLDVYVSPEFVSFPGNKSVTVGNPVLLYCDVYANPAAKVYWIFQESTALPPTIAVSSDGGTLSIASVVVSHSGLYTCRASNDVGDNHKILFLDVQEVPFIREIIGGITVDLGNDLDLDCQVQGRPLPIITWSHEGKTLEPTIDGRIQFPSPSRLLVRYVVSQDGGYYQCLATNTAGHHRKGVNVRIRGPPAPPTLDSVTSVSMTSVLLKWSPAQQDSVTTVTAFVIQYKIKFAPDFRDYHTDVPSEASSVEVENLRPATDYVFRMAAKNTIGQGEYSAVLGGRTLEDAPGAPHAFKLLSVTSFSASLQWEKPVITNGEIRSYQLQHKLKYNQADYIIHDIAFPSLPLQQYTLDGLTPYTSYYVRVRAATINPSGVYLWGNFTDILEFATMASVPSAAPSALQLLAVSPTSIEVTWKRIPTVAENGPLRGYKLTYSIENQTSPSVILLEHAATVTIVTNLLPWQWYTVSMAAYNDVGTGPQTEQRRVRTLATAPVGYPQGVTLKVLSSTSFQLTWKEVALLERHSDISGYIVLYQVQGDVEGESSYINNPNVLQTVISGVLPFTTYIVQIQAFTTQVSDGFGPLSPPQQVTTLEDVPTAVSESDVQYDTTDTEILLKWNPPSQPNGKILGYVIMYSVMASDDITVNSDKASRKKRSTAKTVSIQEPEYSIKDVLPSTQYLIAIAARTKMGTGAFTNITIQTAPSPLTTQQPAIVITEDTDGNEIDAAVKLTTTTTKPVLSSEATAGIIAGATLMGLLLLVVIIAICVLCIRRRRKRRQQADFVPAQPYAIRDTPPLGYQDGYQSAKHPRHIRETVPYTGTTASDDTTEEYSPQLQVHHKSGSRRKQHGHRHHTSQPVRDRYDEGEGMEEGEESQASSVTPVIMPVSQYRPAAAYGIDNPAFYDIDNNATAAYPSTYPSIPSNNTTALHLSSPANPHLTRGILAGDGGVMLSKRRKMDRASAAAIAVQRERAASPFLLPTDTQQLIGADGSGLVVYDERTAL